MFSMIDKLQGLEVLVTVVILLLCAAAYRYFWSK